MGVPACRALLGETNYAENTAGVRHKVLPRARACRDWGEPMYAWIDDQKWAEYGQPPLVEAHGYLVGHEVEITFGRLVSPAEDSRITRLLLQDRLQLEEDQDRGE